MKKILTGLSNNITSNKQKIKVWAESFRKHSDGEVVLIAANADNKDIKTCEELNLPYYQVIVEDTWHLMHKRLEHTSNFIKQSDGDIFLVSDVFDVVFQSDPFEKLDLINYDLFVSGEGLFTNEEPWNVDVLSKVFPNQRESFLNSEIVCAGIVAGKKDQIVELYDEMFRMCEMGSDDHNIKDQAALIIMVAKNEIPRLKIFNLTDAWAMHCAAAGPTEFFISWGLKNIIESRFGAPEIKNGVVYTKNGIKYDMVHQFNRVPEWKEILTKEYE